MKNLLLLFLLSIAYYGNAQSTEFSPGILLVKSDDMKYGLVNQKTMDTILPAVYTLIGSLHEEMAMAVIMKDGGKTKRGFVNSAGHLVIPLDYDCAKDFSESLSAVCVNHIWGFIDSKGKVVIPLQFKSARSFEKGLARVSDETGDFFINKKGERQ